MMYLFDSNAFIAASRLHYGFDLAPGFWEWIAKAELEGVAASSVWVRKEINDGKKVDPSKPDLLKQWASEMRPSFWLGDSEGSVRALAEISLWTNQPEQIYKPSAIAEFLGSTDFQLIALAKATGATIVTSEKSEPNSKKRVKIPDVCMAFDVAYSDPFTAYRTLGLKLLCP